MPDWDDLMKRAKEDVLCALDVWSAVLEESLGSRLEYSYAKGSALKSWNSPIDYVPIISDLDMHIMLSDSEPVFPPTNEGFASSIKMSEKFEERFIAKRPDNLHIPRAQIVHINPNLGNSSFILPQIADVQVLVGSPPDFRLPKIEDIRNFDYTHILELNEYLEDLPRQAFDRVGLDFWQMLRRMNWRVSPSPVRLLTQNHPSPLYVWKWNRTRIVKELQSNNYHSIADSYQKFYETGWNLFLSNFASYSDFRNIIVHGYNVLHSCLEEIKNLDHNHRA